MSRYRAFGMRLACTAALAIVTGTADAIQCGDVITADTVLTADLGPCPHNGLVFGGNGITLSLNGHQIIGTGAGYGVLLNAGNVYGPATIQGPGVIGRFTVGVWFRSVNNVTIRDLTFLANPEQIRATQSGNVLITNNDLIGQGVGGFGIHLGESTGVTIERNTIMGHTGNGIEGVFTGQVSIIGNVIRKNRVGISSGIEPGRWTIRDNNVSFNQEDGIVAQACTVIEGNHANQNGGTGIWNGRAPGVGCPVRENSANQNGLYGIAVVGGYGFQVTGNQTLHNSTDLFWDGSGTGNCWSDNMFKTSSPAVLPACQ
jgi:hypothetical protein